MKVLLMQKLLFEWSHTWILFSWNHLVQRIKQYHIKVLLGVQGRSQDFSKGGHTGSNNIVMAFSPRNIVGCLLKKRLTKGGGVTGTPGPPSLRPWGEYSFEWSQT